MRFWLRKGVDGFRVDVIWHLIKDAEFRDNPPIRISARAGRRMNKSWTRYSTDQPEVPRRDRRDAGGVTDEFEARVLIGEIYLPLHRLVAYYGNDLSGAQMPFNFALLSTLWSARAIETIIADYEKACRQARGRDWVLGNHDPAPAGASRVGPAQARGRGDAAAELRGTPTLYYGDEIGMHQVSRSLLNRCAIPLRRSPGIGVGRDGCRHAAYSQWDATRYAGFSQAPPLAAASRVISFNENVGQSPCRSAVDPLTSTRRCDPASPSSFRRWSREATCRSRPTATCCCTGASTMGAGDRWWRSISAPRGLDRPSELIGLDGAMMRCSRPTWTRHGEPIHGTLDTAGQ